MSHIINISHVNRLNKRSSDYYLVHGEAEDTLPSWYIMKSNARAMESISCEQQQQTNLSALGEIIESGFGYQPPPHVLKEYTE